EDGERAPHARGTARRPGRGTPRGRLPRRPALLIAPPQPRRRSPHGTPAGARVVASPPPRTHAPAVRTADKPAPTDPAPHDDPTPAAAASDAVVKTLADNHREFLAFLERRVGDRATAEDILQDAFTRGLDRVG